MNLTQLIKKRRSIHHYLDKDVHYKEILKIIEAGSWAPSSGNIQNWDFTVIKNQETREKITRACSNQLWMLEAPVFIVICSDLTKIKTMFKKNADKFSLENCAAAIQNMLLKATELKLGTCWVGAFNPLIIRKILNIPDNINISAIITLGYPNEKPLSKRHPIDELTYFESYQNKERDTSLFPLAKHIFKIKKRISK